MPKLRNTNATFWVILNQCVIDFPTFLLQHHRQYQHLQSSCENRGFQWPFALDGRRGHESGLRFFAAGSAKRISTFPIQFREWRRRCHLQSHEDWWFKMASHQSYQVGPFSKLFDFLDTTTSCEYAVLIKINDISFKILI